MKQSFIDIIRKEFENNNEITLKEIYNRMSKISDLKIPNNEIHHRIRSAIHHLKKNNEIVRVGEGKYKKVIV